MKTLCCALLARFTKTFTSFLFGLTLWLSPQLVMGQPVYNGNVTFTTQAEVDAWSPAYTSITGSLFISGLDITDLTPLQNITSVGGDLEIKSNPILESLAGLDAITSIGGSLFVWINDALTNLTELDAVSSIGGTLLISSNADLTSLTGLGAVSSIGAELLIGGNATLTSLSGLGPVATIGDNVHIGGNAALTSLVGLDAITTIGGVLSIYSNNALTSLTGLDAVSSIERFLNISSNPTLTSLAGLGSVSFIGGFLQISNNASLTSLTGLGPVSSIGGFLLINDNATLTSLTGLGAITSTGGSLEIYGNAALTSLTGLDALTSVGGALRIESNAALTSLTGLGAVTSILTLVIGDNTSLTNLTGLGTLISVGGGLYIQYNAALTNLTGLDAVTSIGSLNIIGNPVLTSLTGLDAVTSIGGGSSVIVSNNGLTSLTGLDAVTSIGGHFSIIDNAALTSLTGLNNIASVGQDLFITNNLQLTDCCAIYDLLNTPGAIGGTITIQNNQTGCDSEAEINTYCDDGDLDNDGYTVEEGDCDDTSADVHPGALEICGNGTDDDCDGLTDEEYTQIKIHKDGQQNVSCYGGSDGSIDIHATGGQTPYSFEWSSGATTEDASGLPAGTHTVTVVDALGRCRTKSFTLTQPSQLTLTFSHDDVSCHGGSDGKATAQPSGGSGNKTYLWSNGETTKKIKDLSAGTYSVTVTDAKGCTVVGSVEVGEPAELLITNVTVTPSGGNYQLTVSATGGNQPYKYRRSKPNGNWTNWQTSSIFNNVPAGVYTIQVKDDNACTASATVNVPGGMFLPPPGADDRAAPQVFNDNPDREHALPESRDALLLYPNPARNQLSMLKKDFAGKKAVVTITNNLGALLLRQEVEVMPDHALTLDLSGFQDGLYFLTISAEGFPAVTKRFVVVR